MSAKIKWAIVAAPIGLIAAALAWLAPLMAPVKDGTPAEFWHAACGVRLPSGPSGETWSGTYAPRDGWFVYYLQGWHGRFLYRVPASDVQSDFPEVLSRLNAGEPAESAYLRGVSGYRGWAESEGEKTPESLVAALRQARFKEMREEKGDEIWQHALKGEEWFEERWKRTNRFWLNIVFEFTYLSAGVVFVAWPWLRRKDRRSWATHVAMAPLVLFLPYFLGYCQYTMTSAGPSGGALYPWLIVRFRWLHLPLAAEEFMLQGMPPLLEPLSQRLGPYLGLTGMGGIGVLATAITGLVLGGLTFAIGAILLRWRKKMTARANSVE